jgi:hypothetical protein
VEHGEKIVKDDTGLLGEESLLFPLYPLKTPHEIAWN